MALDKLLAILLLSVAATDVHASAISLPLTGSPSYEIITDGGIVSGSAIDFALPGAFINGVEFSTGPSGLPFPGADDGASILSMSDSGPLNGILSGTGSLPVSYDIQASSNGMVTGWELNFFLGSPQDRSAYGSGSLSGSFSSGSASGSGLLPLSGVPITGSVVELVGLVVGYQGSLPADLSVTFSFDFGPADVDTADIPEPTSWLLLGSGLGLLACLRRLAAR